MAVDQRVDVNAVALALVPSKPPHIRIVGVVLVSRSVTPVEAADRLLELEQGIQQLTGAIDHYRKTGQSAREFSADSPLSHLSNRERQVLDLLGQGYRPRSIAEELHLSPETVRNHLKAMFKKTGTHSQEELTAMLRAVRLERRT